MVVLRHGVNDMNVIDTILPEVKIIEPKILGDERGFFYESFQKERYAKMAFIHEDLVQDNLSRSSKGVLRGLHCQTQHSQGKLVSVLSGKIFDVAVDIRSDSPHFKKWVGVELSAENRRQLWIPKGFAHGFLVLSDLADFAYKCTDYYYPEYEVAIRYDDPDIKIVWPKMERISLSQKDESARFLMSIAQEDLPKMQLNNG
jgi:dTDP-4-dehydrorhamnose 3,5-epimerase